MLVSDEQYKYVQQQHTWSCERWFKGGMLTVPC